MEFSKFKYIFELSKPNYFTKYKEGQKKINPGVDAGFFLYIKFKTPKLFFLRM